MKGLPLMSATATTATATATATAARAAKAVESAISALSRYARSPKQTFEVCRSINAATASGATIRAIASDARVLSAGFSSARIGHFAKAYSRVIDAMPADYAFTGTDAEHAAVANMLTAVSGGTTGIKSAVLDYMTASARERGVSAFHFANELYREYTAHTLATGAAAQESAKDTAPADTADTAPADAAPADMRAETALAFLARLTTTVSPDAFDAATLAAIATAATALAERATLAAAVGELAAV